MARQNKNHKKKFNDASHSPIKKVVSQPLAETSHYIRVNYLNRRKRNPVRALQLMQDAARNLIILSHDWPNGEITNQDKDRVGILLLILGENTRHIDPRTRKEHLDIPWKNLMQVRNFLAHNPQLTDDVFWNYMSQFIRRDLPKVKAEVEKLSYIFTQDQKLKNPAP